MRNWIGLATLLMCGGSAFGQAISHGNSSAGHPSSGLAGGRAGTSFGSGMHASPGGPARMSPSNRPHSFAPSSNFANRQADGQSGYDSGYGQGNWTSAGFIPSRNNNGQFARGGNQHVGYGGVGFPFFAYPYGYAGGGSDFYGDQANDPNLQANSAQGQDPNAPYGVQQGPYASQGPGDSYQPGYGQGSYPGGYGPEGNGVRQTYSGRDPGPGYAESSNVTPTSDGLSHPGVTLVFKDGRKPMQIHNYAITQTKVFVRDNGTERDVSISDLDIPATMDANDQTGVQFELPVRP